jgi:hypothetical protein
MVEAHLFVSWLAESVLKYLSEVLYLELRSYIFSGLPSLVLGSVVLPAQMDMFLQCLDLAGQPMDRHADSHGFLL